MTRFLDIAKNRYSCRNYDARPVEEEKLKLVLEAGRVAPSAVNFQPWHFYVIRGEKELEQVPRSLSQGVVPDRTLRDCDLWGSLCFLEKKSRREGSLRCGCGH